MDIKNILSKCDHTLLAQTSTWEQIKKICDDGMKYATASHLCACGCGEKVVTPISKQAWSLLFNGEGITLSPSIGNYEQACKSHYFIQENCIIWCGCHRNKIRKPSKAKRKNKKRWFKFWCNRSDDR